MDIFIIGGSRFVGPLLIEELLKNGHSITVFNRGQIKDTYEEGIVFVQGDREKGFNVKQHFDVVIDMCAYTGEQTKAALDQLSCDFFINFGSAASYKKTGIFPLTEESLIGEWPVWGDYNKGKVECEEVLQKSDIKFASIRPVYLLGPHNYCDRENFIYSHIKHGQDILIPGNGEAVIQFAFSRDIVKIITMLAEKQLQGAFNCAGDTLITLNGLVEYMGQLVGRDVQVKYNHLTDGDNFNEEEFPFANANFICSNEKLKRLGISFTPLLEGLKEDYFSYYKDID